MTPNRSAPTLAPSPDAERCHPIRSPITDGSIVGVCDSNLRIFGSNSRMRTMVMM